MKIKENLSTELKIEEFAKELGLQLRLLFLEKKSKEQDSLDEVVKPVTAPQISKNFKVKE
ncbi:MAG: hypothetical protein NTW69_02630 [Chloroflexi bacterium]|nr:hypothetical protein [Chloroflexota bacterium]